MPSLTTGPNTERNLANDVMSTDNLFSIGDVLKQKKRSVKSCQCLKQCEQSPRKLLVQQFYC